MKKRILLSVLVAGMLILGIEGVCLAGVEPSPFQPEINQLHSIELNVAAINKRLAKLNESEALPEGATNYLNAMANQMEGLKTRLDEVLLVLPSPSSSTPYIGQAEAAFALDSIRGDSKEVFNSVRDISTRMGIEPSPFLPLFKFNVVSRNIIIQVNDLLDPIQFPIVIPPPSLTLP